MLKPVLLSLGLLTAAGAAQASCSLPGNATEIVTAIAQGLNETRAAYGLSAVTVDQRLSRAATGHGCDMSQNAFFGHRGSDGSDLSARVTRTGYGLCLAAENLAYGYPPGEIVGRWMGSPGHRSNILHPRAQEFGTAVVMGADGPIYVLVLARPC
jgi:uncharacterized protein YkwD